MGASILFDAGTEKIVPTDISLVTLTLMAWVKATTVPPSQVRRIISREPGGANEMNYTMGLHTSSGTGWTFTMHFPISGWVGAPVGNYGYDTNWHHLAATYDQSNMKSYIDGIKRGETAEDESPTNDGTLNIGKYDPSTSLTWLGRIAYPLIYNRALSAAEIVESMWKPGSVPGGMKLNYHTFGVDSGSEYDKSGNNNTGTITGATADPDGPPVICAV